MSETKNKREEKRADSEDIADLNFNDLKEHILRDDRSLWEKHLRLRGRFEEFDIDPLSFVLVSSLEEARRRGFETVSKILAEFERQQGQLTFSPSHGIGHAIRDYLHALILASEDADPKEAYVRIMAGTLHDILGCSLMERFEEGGRSLRHAEASALLFWWLSRKVGMGEKEALPIYYALAAHTNYLKGMEIADGEGGIRKIEPYKKYYMDGSPIYFLHAVQEVDRLDFASPCGFLRYYLSIAELIGKESYYGPMGKFFPVSFSEHMRPLLRTAEEIARDVTGATTRELLFSVADTQIGNSPYSCGDGAGMIRFRDSYCESFLRILEDFDVPVRLSVQERGALFSELNGLIVQRIEPTEETQKTFEELREMFYALPPETQAAWFSVFKSAMREYEIWRENFQKEIADIPEDMLSLPVLGRVDRIIQ